MFGFQADAPGWDRAPGPARRSPGCARPVHRPGTVDSVRRVLGNRRLEAMAGAPMTPPGLAPDFALVQRYADHHAQSGLGAPPIVGEVLRGPGVPLPAELRASMERAFAGVARGISPVAAPLQGKPVISEPGDAGEREADAIAAHVASAPPQAAVTTGGPDFGAVRIHDGADAAAAARSISASAYTAGHDIVFAAGRYQPGTPAGRALLAHELTHVVQQRPISAQGARSSSAVVQRDAQPGDRTRPVRDMRTAGGGSKALAKGVLTWGMNFYGKRPVMQIIFSPFKEYRAKQITFLQTLRRLRSSAPDGTKNAQVDALTLGRENEQKLDEFDPFYGAEWDNQSGTWVPEQKDPAAALRNQPSSAADPNAYMNDAPFVYPDQLKLFESVAVVVETGEVLGAISWGVKGTPDGIEPVLPDAVKDGVSDKATAGFLAAMDRFYAQPPAVGPEPYRDERYDAIVDGFLANDGEVGPGTRGMYFPPLTKASFLDADRERKIDPIVAKLKRDPTLKVEIGGFADATEKNPRATSEARALEVQRYLVAQGVPQANIIIAGYFGAAWPLFAVDPAAPRNRRVQLRVHT